MDFPLVLRHRLKELGTEQRDLAAAAQVTESYISQLMTGKKAPPAPDRTDIYDRMETFLKLPAGKLAALADLQRTEALKRKLADPPTPLFKEVREVIVRKCDRGKEGVLRSMFEKEPFGALERLITQKLLDVVKRVTKEELDDENWLRSVARLTDRSFGEMRVIVIESWDIDLATFGMEIVLNRRLNPGNPKRFEFMERELTRRMLWSRGCRRSFRTLSLRGDATAEEIEFLKTLRFSRRRPTALYYYRELQSLRDPLHFRPSTDEALTLKTGISAARHVEG